MKIFGCYREIADAARAAPRMAFKIKVTSLWPYAPALLLDELLDFSTMKAS
jgi:hypothetical protein